MTAAQRLAAFAHGLALEAVPAGARRAAQLHALDTLGCGIAAVGLGEGGHARASLEATSAGGAAHAIGAANGMAAPGAALANGTLCHALDFDDTHAAAVAHVSTVVTPAACAVAEVVDADGAELLAAIIAGNEVVVRVGAAASGAFHRRGFHPTSVCGVFGAAAAAARLRGLSAAQTAHALGIAGSFAGGIFEYLADGAATKPLHAGWAAHGGVLAAQLAEQGATGPATVLEGRQGLYATHGEGADADALEAQLATLGTRWETPSITYKPYPACHYAHAAIDAAAALQPLDPGRIVSIEAAIPEGGVMLVLDPLERKHAPRTPYDAKFSLPYAVAAQLVHGRVDVASFTPAAIAEPEVLALARRVGYRSETFATHPGAFPATLEIELDDGTRLTHTLAYERGHPCNPLSDDEVVAKFRANAALALAEPQAAALEDALLTLADAASARDALAPLRTAAPTAKEISHP